MFLQPQRWHRLRITDFLLPFHGQSPPAPAPCTNCPAFCFCIFRFFLECHINKSVQYRIFHVWLSLLSVMCSGPAILSYVLVHFFVLLSSIPCWGHSDVTLCLSICLWTGICFISNLAVMNKAVMGIHADILWTCFHSLE